MTKRARIARWTLAALLPLALLVARPVPSGGDQSKQQSMVDDEMVAAGKKLYDKSCVYCHGVSGKGDGPVAFFLSRNIAPRPRDFTSEPYKFRSTPSGELPLDGDLLRIITKGRPGYMPAFSALSQTDRQLLVAYVKSLTPDFAEDRPIPEPIEIGSPLPATVQSIAAGEAVYAKLQCAKCHGGGGQGDGPSADTLQTTAGMKILATDLTRPSSYAGGGSAQDVYRTFMTGLNGVPMPSYAGVMTEEESWHLVNYVLSLDREGF